MAKTSTKTNKIDNIGDLQTILTKNLLGEDIDIGPSSIENGEDCLERRIGKFACYEV